MAFDPSLTALRMAYQSAAGLVPESGWIQGRPTPAVQLLPTFGNVENPSINPSGIQPQALRGPAVTADKTFSSALLPEEFVSYALAQMLGAVVSTDIGSGAAYRHDINHAAAGNSSSLICMQTDFDDSRRRSLLDGLFSQLQIQVSGGEVATVQYTLTYRRATGWDRGETGGSPVASGPQLRGYPGTALAAELDLPGSLDLKVISVGPLLAEVKLGAGAYAGTSTVEIPADTWTELLDNQATPNAALGLFPREPVQIYWPAATHAAAAPLDEWTWTRLGGWVAALPPATSVVTGVHATALFDSGEFPVEDCTITITRPVFQDPTFGFWREQTGRSGQLQVQVQFSRRMTSADLLDRLASRESFRFEFQGRTGVYLVADTPATEVRCDLILPLCIAGGDAPGIDSVDRRTDAYTATAHESSDPDWPGAIGAQIVNSLATVSAV